MRYGRAATVDRQTPPLPSYRRKAGMTEGAYGNAVSMEPAPTGATFAVDRLKRIALPLQAPQNPRTIARPTEVATERAALFIAASITVSRW